jgi:hypothetical protein
VSAVLHRTPSLRPDRGASRIDEVFSSLVLLKK